MAYLALHTTAANCSCKCTPIWRDEFDFGSLNPNIWSYDTGAGSWGNQELLQTYTTDEEANVDVGGGFLNFFRGKMTQLTLLVESKLRTKYPFNTEWSKPPLRSLMLKRIFGLPFGRCGKQLWFSVGWPFSGEIDITEISQGLAIQEGVANR
jgi:hypothetical protein